MKMRTVGTLALLLVAGLVWCEEKPWFTGPLIAPVGEVVPYGRFKSRNFVYCNVITSGFDHNGVAPPLRENFYNIVVEPQWYSGLTPWCDLEIATQIVCNSISDQLYCNSGDLLAGLDFQLMDADLTPYFPGIKFGVKEIFPVGNFRLFHPRKMWTDQTGGGAFATRFELVLYKLCHLRSSYWMSMTVSAQYIVPSTVHVRGFNTYGGGFGANGREVPGNQFQATASFEWTLSRRWAFSWETIYKHVEFSQFYGIPGVTFDGTFSPSITPGSDQLSMAAAIEYNYNKHFGIIAGSWFSLYNQSSPHFASGVVNFQYFY